MKKDMLPMDKLKKMQILTMEQTQAIKGGDDKRPTRPGGNVPPPPPAPLPNCVIIIDALV